MLTEFLHHIILFLSHWIRGSVYENNLRACFHVLTKHVFIVPICVVHMYVFTYIISTHYLLVISMADIWNSHYNSLASANMEHTWKATGFNKSMTI
jgi:hypothetical protein